MQDKRIRELSVNEYFYLTENLDCTDKMKIDRGVKYIIYNKRQKLIEVVRNVMQNELSDFERSLATDYWCHEISAEELATKHQTSRSNIHRYLVSARKKLEKHLKYVLLYDKISLPQSTKELFEYVRLIEH